MAECYPETACLVQLRLCTFTANDTTKKTKKSVLGNYNQKINRINGGSKFLTTLTTEFGLNSKAAEYIMTISPSQYMQYFDFKELFGVP